MYQQQHNPLVLPQPSGAFFGFKGNPATITVTKKEGTYVDGKLVEPQEPKKD